MVTSSESPLSVLQQRLRYVTDHPERDWTLIVDNVPMWPTEHRPALEELLSADPFEYAPCEGLPETIEAIVNAAARDHDVAITPGNVLVTNGAMHAIRLVADHYRSHGNRAFVARPVLSAVPKLLTDAGYEVTYFDPTPAGISVAALNASESRDVGIVYLNSPNNPTGRVVEPSVLAALAQFSSAVGAGFICDQVYDEFQPDGVDTSSPLLHATESGSVFYLNSMSKNYGLPGLRIGWIISTPANITRLAGRLERENVAVAGPPQSMTAALLRDGNAVLQEEVAKTRAELITRIAQSPTLTCDADADERGGSALVVRVPVSDVESFADMLLTDYDVAVTTPANFSGVDPDDQAWIRVPLGYPREVMMRAISTIESALADIESTNGSARVRGRVSANS